MTQKKLKLSFFSLLLLLLLPLFLLSCFSFQSAIASTASVGVVEASSQSCGDASRQVTTCKGKYKLKTRKAAAKRFKVTGNGKVLRRKQGKQHLNTKKNTKRKRFLSAPAVVEKGDIPNIKASMPNHKIK